MSTPLPHYCIDTSSLINWWDEDYTPEVFEGLPDRLADLIAQGRLRSTRAVQEEIKDGLSKVTLAKWCKSHIDFYIEDDPPAQLQVREIMANFQSPKKKLGIGGADPFVIARAILNGPHWYVISNENPAAGNAHKNPNLPFVCTQLNVNHIRFLDMLKLEGWKLK